VPADLTAAVTGLNARARAASPRVDPDAGCGADEIVVELDG